LRKLANEGVRNVARSSLAAPFDAFIYLDEICALNPLEQTAKWE